MYIGKMRQLKTEMKIFRIENDLFLVEKAKSDINGNNRYKVHFICGDEGECRDAYLGTYSIQAYSEKEAAINVYCNMMPSKRGELNVIERLS